MKYLEFRHPTRSEMIEAKEIYEDKFLECKESGLYTKDEMKMFLRRIGLLTGDIQKQMNDIEGGFFFRYPYSRELSSGNDQEKNKYIDKCLNEVYTGKRRIRVSEITSIIRSKLDPPEDKRYKDTSMLYKNITTTLNQYTSHTCEAIAETAMSDYLISACSYNGDTKERIWKDVESFHNSRNRVLVSAVSIIASDFLSGLSSTVIRYIARLSSWKIRWIVATKLGKDIFPEAIDEWDLNKVHLGYWSCFYDNVSESSEPPEEFIIKDDEMLDSYLENKRKEHNKGSSQNDDGMIAHFRTKVNPINKNKKEA